MNYQKHYNLLIEKAKLRNWDKKSAPCYIERHHIIPRCLNGNNTKENIVCLTYQEHRIAHLLLCKMHPNNYKLLCAVKRMHSYGKYHSGRKCVKETEWARIRHSEAASAFFLGKPKGPFTEEHKRKISEANKGNKDSVETRIKKSNSNKGKFVSEETKNKNREARKRQANGGDKRVSILGIEYKSIGEAERQTGISRFTLWRRLNLSKYEEYFYL